MLSFWEKNSFLHYDYIIVGSGILGLSTACELKERNQDKTVLVLERGIFPTGASTKNAGFLCFGSLTEILADIELKGEKNAIDLVEQRWKGINILRQRLTDEKTGYLNYGGYELVDDKHLPAVEKMDYINDLLKHIFPEQVFETRGGDIGAFGFNSTYTKALVYSPYEAQIDTGKMMSSLIDYAQSLGIHILNGCDVKEVFGNSVNVHHTVLNETAEFKAEQIILCANAFTNALLPELIVKPGRGQVVVTRPIDNLKFKGIFHIDEGFYYFRNYGKRVMFGGGRNLDFAAEETGEFLYNEAILTELRRILDEVILPEQKYEIEDMWTGIMGFTENKLPKILNASDNIIAAVSCNGMGIALASYIAKEIVDSL